LAQSALAVPVISIGNITAGGTGKTPFVIWMANELTAAGRKVAVLSRGYRRQDGARFLVVSDGSALRATVGEAGDEPYLIARRCPASIGAVGADRAALGRWLLSRYACDVIVLDDGFQHRGLRRQVDLVLVDATDERGLSALLPAGRLREPLTELRRASAVILTRVDTAGTAAISRRLASAHVMPTVRIRFEAEGWMQPGRDSIMPLSALSGERVLACSGIANPEGFDSLLRQAGVLVVEHQRYRDHHRYGGNDVERLRDAARRLGATRIVTTEKDLVKLEGLMSPDDGLVAVRLAVNIVDGLASLRGVLERGLAC
jgi:tetraacyldisaccharide 4'-kinase